MGPDGLALDPSLRAGSVRDAAGSQGDGTTDGQRDGVGGRISGHRNPKK